MKDHLFKPGESGNPHGRPKGAKNRVNAKVKETIENLLSGLSLEELQKDMRALDPKERITAYTKLAEYLVPKLNRTEVQHELPDDGITFKMPDVNRPK